MDELTEKELQQVELSVNYVNDVVMPSLEQFENVLLMLAEDGEFIGSPHFDAVMFCIRELVERGWTSDELVEQVRHHAQDQESERGKRVVN